MGVEIDGVGFTTFLTGSAFGAARRLGAACGEARALPEKAAKARIARIRIDFWGTFILISFWYYAGVV